jgi:hypothetical protein
MPVAVPLAIVGAGIAGSAISAGAAKSAAGTQAQAAQQATNVQQAMYNQTRSDLAPYRTAGSAFLPGLQRLLGVDANGNPIAPTVAGVNGGAGAFTSGGFTPTGTTNVGDKDFSAYVQNNPDLLNYWNSNPDIQKWWGGDMGAWGQAQYNSSGKAEGRQVPLATNLTQATNPQEAALEAIPGYQFARDQGVQQISRALGSTGQTGAQAKGIARFVTGLADQTYGEQYNRMLQGAQLGENAAAQTGNIGANYAGNISNTIVGAGTANAAGTVGAANAASAGLSSIPSALILNKILGSNGSGGTGGNLGMYDSLSGTTSSSPGNLI